MGPRRFSGIAVLFSLLGVGLSWIVGEGILGLGEQLPGFVVIGLYFGVAAMCIGAMILASQGVSPKLIGYRWRNQYYKTSFKLFIPVTLIMVGLAAGIFQVFYALEINEPQTIKNIVIAIDRSGSMAQTDPDGERFKAVGSLIDHLNGDKRVALMTFSDHAKLEIDFTNVRTTEEKEAFKNQLSQLVIKDDGQTGVRELIESAYELMKHGSMGASLILVSDGGPTDGSGADISKLVADYMTHQIPIYTIGMMYTDPTADAYLREISNLTGGAYHSTSDTTMLNEAFSMIQYHAEKGTLISPRTGGYLESTLHCVLRILFNSLLVVLIGLALGILFDNKYLAWGMLLGGAIGGVLASVLMEVLLARGMEPFFVRGIYWLVTGLCLMSFTGCITFKDSYHGTREA